MDLNNRIKKGSKRKSLGNMRASSGHYITRYSSLIVFQRMVLAVAPVSPKDSLKRLKLFFFFRICIWWSIMLNRCYFQRHTMDITIFLKSVIKTCGFPDLYVATAKYSHVWTGAGVFAKCYQFSLSCICSMRNENWIPVITVIKDKYLLMVSSLKGTREEMVNMTYK